MQDVEEHSSRADDRVNFLGARLKKTSAFFPNHRVQDAQQVDLTEVYFTRSTALAELSALELRHDGEHNTPYWRHYTMFARLDLSPYASEKNSNPPGFLPY